MTDERTAEIADHYVSRGGSPTAEPGAVVGAKQTAARPKTAHKLRRAAGLAELTPRHKLLAQYMACGTDHARARRLELPLNTPLSLEQACDVLSIRRRNGREISALPEWQKLYLSLVSALRSGEHGRSVATLIAMRDREGANSAADAKVRVDASKALLGEADTQLNVSVSVNDNVGLSIKPGYVIRSPQAREPVTIEGEARESPALSPQPPALEPSESGAYEEFRRRWGPQTHG